MRFLYLIFSHDNQEQLARLAATIRRLSPLAAIVIHHDPSKEPLDSSLFSTTSGVLTVPDPVKGEWGDWSLVEQYLHAMRWCRSHVEFEWICTLTGLSYPVASLSEFERRLLESRHDAYVRYFDPFDPGPYPKGVWPKGTGESRYLFRYFKLPRFRHYYILPAPLRRFLAGLRERINRSALIRIIPMPRGARTRLGLRRGRLPFPAGFKLYAGRQMINLSRDALDAVLAYVDAHPRYVRYFRRTLIPDEAFFISIVANAPQLRICNDVLRYIWWPKDLGAASVGVIREENVDAAFHSGAPFALKLDARVDSKALDRIDARLSALGESVEPGR